MMQLMSHDYVGMGTDTDGLAVGHTLPGQILLAQIPEEWCNMNGAPVDGDSSTTGMSGAGVFSFPRLRDSGLWVCADTVLVGIYTGDAPRVGVHWITRGEAVAVGIEKFLQKFPTPPNLPRADEEPDFFEL